MCVYIYIYTHYPSPRGPQQVHHATAWAEDADWFCSHNQWHTARMQAQTHTNTNTHADTRQKRDATTMQTPVIHPCIHASIHPYVHASMHPCIHASIHPSIHPSVLTSIHTCQNGRGGGEKRGMRFQSPSVRTKYETMSILLPFSNPPWPPLFVLATYLAPLWNRSGAILSCFHRLRREIQIIVTELAGKGRLWQLSYRPGGMNKSRVLCYPFLETTFPKRRPGISLVPLRR